MSKSYDQILQEIERLKEEAESLRQQEVGAAIAEAKALIAKFGLTAADLGLGEGKKAAVKSGRSKVAPKYRSDSNALDTWSGRGKTPRWLDEKLKAGRKLEEFAIPA